MNASNAKIGIKQTLRNDNLTNYGALLSVPETAKRLNISSKGTWHLIYRREIGSITIGKRRMVSEHQIEKYLNEREILPIKANQRAFRILGR
jgi:excisionase family DNA binding protein